MTNEKICPLMAGECIEHKCRWYTHVLGRHPQTGTELDHYDCAIAWMPMLLIESTQQTRQAGAAIESFRNEMVRGNEQTQHFLLVAAKQKLIGGN